MSTNKKEKRPQASEVDGKSSFAIEQELIAAIGLSYSNQDEACETILESVRAAEEPMPVNEALTEREISALISSRVSSAVKAAAVVAYVDLRKQVKSIQREQAAFRKKSDSDIDKIMKKLDEISANQIAILNIDRKFIEVKDKVSLLSNNFDSFKRNLSTEQKDLASELRRMKNSLDELESLVHKIDIEKVNKEIKKVRLGVDAVRSMNIEVLRSMNYGGSEIKKSGS